MLRNLWSQVQRLTPRPRRQTQIKAAIEHLEVRYMLSNWSGDIPNGTHWTNTEVQRIIGNINIPVGSTLTIDPGTIIKFNDSSFNFTVEGKLLAQGTTAAPVIFTEIRDDVGGDTNGDGTASSPISGSWGEFEFLTGSTGSILDHVNIRYGGTGAPQELLVAGGQLTLSNSSISNSINAGIGIQASNPVLSGDTLQNNRLAAISADLSSQPVITAATVSGNGLNGLQLNGSTLPASVTWNNPSLVYALTGTITVPQGDTLTIGAGQIIKVPGSTDALIVNGTLLSNGTAAAPVIFTADRDDSHGGDTNGNGAANTADNGTWGNIQINGTSTGSVLDHTNLFYGARFEAGEVVDNGGQLTISNSLLANAGGAGLRIIQANPILTGNTFQNNSGAAISMDLSSQPVIAGTIIHDDDKNSINGVQLDGGTLTGNISWNNPGLVYALKGTVTVPQGDTLTIGAGQVIKTPGSTDALIVNGVLLSNGTAAAPVIFTSDRDDSRGGDTNGNGAANIAENSTWGDIQINATSTGSLLDYTNILFGGRSDMGEVVDNGGQLTISNSLLANSGAAGLRIVHANPILTGNTFQNNSGAAISMDLSSQPVITGTIIHDEDKNGINGVQLDAGTLTGSFSWNNTALAYDLAGTLTVPQGDTLTISAGQIVKTPGSTDALIVNGTLLSNGTAAAPVIFTSDRDDSRGGDTNGNGAANIAENSTWGDIQINATGTGSLLDYTNILFGGRSDMGEVVDNGGQLTISNSLLANSGAAGLRIIQANPILTDNIFQNNSGAAISMDLGSSPVINGVSLTNNAFDAVSVDGGSLTANVNWANPEITYFVTGTVTVPLGTTLTVDSGQIVKFNVGSSLLVNGSLLANGSAADPVVFTSFHDNAVGGRLNSSGNGNTVAQPGEWGRIELSSTSTGSVLNHTVISYGGGGVGELFVNGGMLTLTNSLVRDSASAGLRVDGSTAVVTGVIFQHNSAAAINLGVFGDVDGSQLDANGNGKNAIVVDGGTLSADQMWSGHGLDYQLKDNLAIPAGVTLTIAAGTVFDSIENISLTGGGSINNQGTMRKITGTGTSTIAPLVTNQGTVKVESGTLSLTGGVADSGSGVLTGSIGKTLAIGGNLAGSNGNFTGLSSQETVLLNGSGTAVAPQLFDAMSKDQGATAAGFAGPFAYYSLTLSNSTTVKLVPGLAQLPGGGALAVYVDNLVVPSGATLNLNGLHLYARSANVQGAVTGGSVSVLTDGGTLSQDQLTPGNISTTGEVDDWTIFERAGQILTITLGTGNGSPTPPTSPLLNFGQLQLIDPNGNILGTASNTSAGAEVSLTGITLPVDGLYHIKIQAPSSQLNSTGNYVLAAWNASVNTAAADLNQTLTGLIGSPFEIDRWTFSAAAGQVINFNLLNTENPGIVFDLAGPNGFTAFTNQTASDSDRTLPEAGSYSLTVHAVQRETGAYAFRLDTVSAVNLALGQSFTGPLAGDSQTQLFKVTVPTPQQLQVLLSDTSTGDHNEVYVKLGSAPTRSDYQYKYSTPASANQLVNVPAAAAGDWYVLVYTEAAANPGAITLQVKGASVFLSSVSPDHSGNGVDMTLTLNGVGFDHSTAVSLVSASNTVFHAASANLDLPTQITATFNAGAVPAGIYSVQLTKSDGSTTTLPYSYTVTAGGQAHLVAHIVAPNSVSRHIASTIYVQYSNTGTVAMPAPLLALTALQDGVAGAYLTLDSGLQVAGFWTSATPAGYSQTVQILASGATPGFLEPGESVTVPVYYGGWNINIGNFSSSPISFELGVLTEDSTAPVNWTSEKSHLQPANISSAAWDGVYANFMSQMGATWGSLIQRLDQDAAYLGSLGEHVTDISQLFSFEIEQAIGIGPMSQLSSAVDMDMASVGLSLQVGRTFDDSIIGRNLTGPFGNGWQLAGGWGQSLAVASDGTVTISEGENTRLFQPDSRGNDFFTDHGDYSTLANLGGGIYTLTDLNGQVTEFQNGQVEFRQDANGNRITAGYTNGLMTTLTVSSGQSITLSYNGSGRITDLHNSLGQSAHYTYDSTNQYLLSATDMNGYTTTCNYVMNGGPTINNALISVTNPDGTQLLFSYDPQGRLSVVSAAGGAIATHFGYTAPGSVTLTDSTNDTTTYSFDNRELLAKIVDPLQRMAFYSYDAQGHLVTATNPDGASTSFAYDTLGHVIQSIDPLGNVTKYAFGTLNRLSSVTDPKGNASTFQYDQHGNLVSQIFADGTVESRAYNPIGELTQSTDGDKNVVNYAYDAAGRLTSKTYADNSQAIYHYDPLGNLTSVVDSTGTTMLTYDSANRLTQISYPDSTFLKYSYDAAGRRTQMVDQTGFTVNYHYDTLGRLDGLRDGAGNSIVAYSYNSNNQLVKETNGNGTTTTYTYDPAGEVLSVVNQSPDSGVNSSFVYTYNNLGLAAIETTLQGQWNYSYDATGQLTHAIFASNDPGQVPNQDLQYFYDASGNRTHTITNGVTTTYTTNSRNEYTSTGSTFFAYDANGNRVSQTDATGTTSYSYNANNQLIGLNPASSPSTSYVYDAFGKIYSATLNGQQTHYLNDPLTGNQTGQFGAGGSLIADHIFGRGLVNQINADGTTLFYDFDLLGSTVGLSNSAGAYVNSYSYDPFGNLLMSNEAVANPFQFAGAYGVVQATTDLDFMGARFYDPALGGFISQDPIGLAGADINTRRYVGNDPINYVDPSGLRRRGVTYSGPKPRPVSAYPGGIDPDVPVGDYGDDPGESGDDSDVPGDDFGEDSGPAMGVGDEYGGDGDVPVDDGGGVEGDEPSGGFSGDPGSDFGGGFEGDPEPPVAAGPVPIATGTVNPVKGKPRRRDPAYALPVFDYFPITSGDIHIVLTAIFRDPNDMIGPAGFGTASYIDPLVQSIFPYRIDFENEPAATAPVQIATITDQLDPNLDWNTFALTGVGFGDTVFNIPSGSQYYQTTIPMTENGVTFTVQVTLGIHSATGQVYATFYSLDPETSLPPDVLSGFLPPEDGTGRGSGYISFVVDPKQNLITGTEIRNVGVVVFGNNPPISTDQVDDNDPSLGVNPAKQALITIDAAAPNSEVASLPVHSSPSFVVNWSGTDDEGGSGIAFYDVYVSVDGGGYTAWQAATTATSATYVGLGGHTYAYYSVATDNVGHVEAAPLTADATTTAIANSPPQIGTQLLGVDETSAVDTIVGMVLASDPDAGDTLTYSITGGNALGAFAINSQTGVITVANSTLLDFETHPSWPLTVQVSDNHGASSSAIVTVNLTNVNEAPALGNQTFTIAENSSSNIVVGVLQGTDPDVPTVLTYSITAGNSASNFTIDPATGIIKVAAGAALNFEATSTYILTVQVTDDGSPNKPSSAQVTIHVTDVNEAPSIPANQSFNISGSALAGAVVGTVAATDPDTSAPNNTKAFSILNGTGAFTINASTGLITVANAAALTALAGQTVTVQVTDTDGGTPALSATQNVSVVVGPANTAPVLANPGAVSTFIGNVKSPVKITPTLTVTDADGPASIASFVISVNLGAAKKNPDIINYPGLGAIGTFSTAIAGGKLVETFTVKPGVTNATIQTMLDNMTFQTKGTGLKVLNRSFQIQVTDVTGLHSNVITQNVIVEKKAPKPPKPPRH